MPLHYTISPNKNPDVLKKARNIEVYQLENEVCRISILEHGSELCEMYDKTKEREYIWQAGPVWPKHSPLLFPSIGGFYDELLAVLGTIYRDRFARHPLNHYFDVAATFGELIDLLTLNDNDRIH